MDSPYLLELAARLADGLARLPEEFRVRQTAYLAGRQNADGGFSGRDGGSDLYYTGFALRSLGVLAALTPEVAERAATFLRASLQQQASVIDLFSWLYCSLLVRFCGGPDILADSPPDWPDRVAGVLETFRTADGGYARNPEAASGSTYHTFLVGLCYQLLDRDLPRPEEVVRFVLSRRRDDGGFVEIAPMRRSGTNPTAAAVGTLQMFADGIPAELRPALIDFLAGTVSSEGGLRANTRVPLADLLSTFTGVWTMDQLGALEQIDKGALKRYTWSLELSTGGFRGGLWDNGLDVEYTFYGLGTLGLLSF